MWKCVVAVLWGSCTVLLELLDFPPLLWAVDAHALWHLSTAPIPLLWYRYAAAWSLWGPHYTQITSEIHLANYTYIIHRSRAQISVFISKIFSRSSRLLMPYPTFRFFSHCVLMTMRVLWAPMSLKTLQLLFISTNTVSWQMTPSMKCPDIRSKFD